MFHLRSRGGRGGGGGTTLWHGGDALLRVSCFPCCPPTYPLPQAGSAGGDDGSDNQQRIREWLERNSEPALPFEARQRRQQQGAAE